MQCTIKPVRKHQLLHMVELDNDMSRTFTGKGTQSQLILTRRNATQSVALHSPLVVGIHTQYPTPHNPPICHLACSLVAPTIPGHVQSFLHPQCTHALGVSALYGYSRYNLLPTSAGYVRFTTGTKFKLRTKMDDVVTGREPPLRRSTPCIADFLI